MDDVDVLHERYIPELDDCVSALVAEQGEAHTRMRGRAERLKRELRSQLWSFATSVSSRFKIHTDPAVPIEDRRGAPTAVVVTLDYYTQGPGPLASRNHKVQSIVNAIATLRQHAPVVLSAVATYGGGTLRIEFDSLYAVADLLRGMSAEVVPHSRAYLSDEHLWVIFRTENPPCQV